MSVKYKIRDQQGLNFLTCTICGWVDLFSRAEFRDIVLDSWRYCKTHKGLQIWGYVFMTNHIHMIVSTKAPNRLEDVMRDFKAHTAKKFLELLHDNKKPESRREWLLYLFRYFGKRLKKSEHQVWQHDNHPIALYSESVVIQKLRYIHNNPVAAKWVRQPEDWLYSSAGNYAEGSGIYDVQLLWLGLEEDGGWFYGNVDYPTLD
ncbi:MAG: transposase [Saprospiraceae bacterium]|nr:transposase [Saprospiraceae bacterium]